jgi:hypothetical protein
MSKPARLREELRPHGVLAPDCSGCVWFDSCGGFEPERTLYNTNCFVMTCCKFTEDAGQVEKCGLACPHNPRFLELLQDIGGMDTEYLPPLVQPSVTLPRYIPLIHHPYSRHEPLDWPAVALDTYQVFKVKEDRLLAVAGDTEGLRRAFGLAPTAAVILRGIGSDRCLERYWEHRRQDAAAEQLARLGLTLVVGPNFSHFLDVPGTERMSNRKRQLLCLDEMMRAGLSPVPHLNAVQPGDWRFWRDFLKASPAIRFVAVEFETGNKAPAEGRKVIDHLTGIQDALGGRLHPIVIGGTQFVEYLAGRFEAASFIDSTPFVKAVHRQGFDFQEGFPTWKTKPTPEGKGIDEILVHNLASYTAWIDQRWEIRDERNGSLHLARPRPVRIPLPLQNGHGQRPLEATLFSDIGGDECKQPR